MAIRPDALLFRPEKGTASLPAELSRPGMRPDLALAALLALSAAALFARAVGHDFTNWDDDHYLLKNPLFDRLSWAAVGEVFTSFICVNYHPLTILSYLLEFSIAGFEPWIYHLTNVLLHGAAAAAAYLLGRTWLESRPAAFLAALVFAVHPLKVESVAWISERKDVLCALFYFAALAFYGRRLDGGGAACYWLALAAFILALLSKAMAVSLPAVLVIYILARREGSLRRFAPLLPFWVLALLFAWLGVRAQASEEAIKGLHGGAPLWHALTLLKAVAFYAEKLLLPLRLSPLYVLEPARSLLEPRLIAGALIVLASAALMARSWRRRRIAFLGFGFFWASWAPVSGMVPSAMLVADRYMYIPSLGLLWIAAQAVEDLARRSPAPAPRRLGRGAVLAAALLFAALTWRQLGVWADSVSLWRSALAENPENSVAWSQLAAAEVDAGHYEEAVRSVLRAVALGRREPDILFNLAAAYRGLEEREKELASARAVREAYPDHLLAALVEARHLRLAGSLEESEELLRRLALRHGEEPRILIALAEIEEARGRHGEALRLYLRALELRPRGVEALAGAASALLAEGDEERAARALEGALALKGPKLHPELARRLAAALDALEGSRGAELRESARRLRPALAARRAAGALRVPASRP
jgi:tetratricopeptide (TPR) repeat protein